MSNDTKPLQGRVALVTGGGRGLGRAFAENLAAMGCDVAVHGMRENGPAEYGEGTTLTETARQIGAQYGVRTIAVLGDLTQSDQVERVLATVACDLGPLYALVHNAGGDIAAAGGKPDPNDAIMVKEVDIRAVIDRNLLSTIFVSQRVAQDMMERREGRIVTISSVAGYGGRRNGAIYATSKAAAIHYTRCLAAQLRPFNVTANSIAPGDTRTGRFMNTRAVDPNRLAEGGTLERIALVDEVARAVGVFVGPTGDFITGQVLRVDGGGQCWPACTRRRGSAVRRATILSICRCSSGTGSPSGVARLSRCAAISATRRVRSPFRRGGVLSGDRRAPAVVVLMHSSFRNAAPA